MLFTQAKNITLKNFQSFNVYEKFMQDSSQEEFSRSQIPFYHAVKAFPRILCYLGSMIEDSETRLHIAENIWEEHGNGKPSNFHINTFNNYLTAIAGQGYTLTRNPWVDEWINNWFKETDTLALACKLAAIEYLYAPISASLSKHIDILSLHNEQHHYSKHAELDWEHGRELFEVALKYDLSEDKSKAFALFDLAQKEFIQVFNGMILITEKEVRSIATDKIAFYYIREDVSVSTSALAHLKDKHKNIITICSGGESIIDYLKLKESADIISLDMNQNQYNLFLKKLELLGLNKSIDELNIGKFERIFKNIRDRFTEEEKSEFAVNGNINHNKLKFVIEDIFTRKNLSIIFTDNAVKYTKKDFAQHFFNVFSSSFKEGSFGEHNIKNIISGKPFKYCSYEDLVLDNKNVTSKIEHLSTGDTIRSVSFPNGFKADIIDLSNIGDWIDLESMREVIKASYEALEDSGVLVMRKLLGDYSLAEEMSLQGFEAHKKEDTGLFYEEVIVGYKYA